MPEKILVGGNVVAITIICVLLINLSTEGGLHYFDSQPIEVSEAAKKSETAIRLWMVSEKLTGLAH